MKKILSKTGSFFKKIGLWFKNHAPTRRRIIQLYAALLTNANIKGLFTGRIYTGGTKNMCVPGLNCYSCPSTVGACPLGALQNALASSDTRTPVFMLGILALFGLMFARTICGFLCPTGLLQDLLYKIHTPKLKKSKVTRILSYFKYVLLVVLVIAVPLAFMFQDTPLPAFCKYICPSGTLGGAVLLLLNPANENVFGMLGGLFTWKFCLLALILLASVFMYRPFCRFICPLGAIYGFFNKIALLGVKVEKDKCVDCGLCVAHCKMDIKHVGDHECINCGECISVCPTKAIVWKGSSIFVKPNDLESENTVKVPLTNFVQPAPAAAATESGTVVTPDMADMQAIEGTAVCEAPSLSSSASAAAVMRKVPRRIYINEKGQKILKIVAVCLASLLLVGAIIYYNFFDVSAPNTFGVVAEVGDELPDFTVETYSGEAEQFTASEIQGKVLVINFWYTTCTPCLEELPEFIEAAANYRDSATFVAIHDVQITEDVTAFLAGREGNWLTNDIIFAQDSMQDNGMTVFETLGGTDYFPRTVIVDINGTITVCQDGKMDYETLEGHILDALNPADEEQTDITQNN